MLVQKLFIYHIMPVEMFILTYHMNLLNSQELLKDLCFKKVFFSPNLVFLSFYFVNLKLSLLQLLKARHLGSRDYIKLIN